MTHHTAPQQQPTPPTPPPAATATAPPETPPKKPRRRLFIGLAALLGFVVVYSLTLFGFHLLARSGEPLKPPDLNATSDTIVLVRLEKLDTVANRLTVKVLVIPEDSMFDKRLDVLKTDTAVRMDPPNDLGDLQ
ncbi:DUF4436 family protein, partial [Mycobacterium sp. E2989]|uniref:DUF4436 family protein n=1 Tax=Mycobacterium sp. E2989 TaxID=1834140 RepID=UPI000B18CF94